MRGKELKRLYNMSLYDYNRLLKEQDGKCAICKTENAHTTRANHFHVDHCHETGRIRGLLCHHCNHLLGHAKDNIQILLNTIRYLKTWDKKESVITPSYKQATLNIAI